jgi:hypothetical protein
VIVEYPESIDALQHHGTEAHELVLKAKMPKLADFPGWFKPPKTFSDRATANQHLKLDKAR